MEYPKPALQPPGSEDCEFYATAYLAGLFGHTVNPDAVKEYREKKTGCGYLMDKLQMRPAWTFPGLTGGKGYKLAYSHQSGYRKWVEAHLAAGFVGLAVIQLIPRAQHAVVFLAADDDGVLMADSCRGLVKDTWADILAIKHADDIGRRRSRTRLFVACDGILAHCSCRLLSVGSVVESRRSHKILWLLGR